MLLATRDASIVEPHETVMLHELTEAEVGRVLRGAARSTSHERLNDDTAETLENLRVSHSWVAGALCAPANDGVPKSREAWADRCQKVIEAQIEAVRKQARRAGETGDLEVNRLTVLRAGFKYPAGRQEDAQIDIVSESALTVFQMKSAMAAVKSY